MLDGDDDAYVLFISVTNVTVGDYTWMMRVWTMRVGNLDDKKYMLVIAYYQSVTNITCLCLFTGCES